MSDTPETPAFDWCVEAARLRALISEIVSGGGIQRTRFKNGEEERETEFSKPNIGELRRLLLDAEARCAQAQTGRPRRFAMTIGRVRAGRSIY